MTISEHTARSLPVVVLAAGRGSRLGPLTDARPKPLLDLAGASLLERMLAAATAAGAGPVTIVTGYRAQLIEQAVPAVTTVHNPRWAESSIAASLLAAADAGALEPGALVVYGDIVAEPRVLAAALASEFDAFDVAVPVNTRWQALWQARMSDVLADAERLILGRDGTLADIGGRAEHLGDIHAQFMGMLRLSPPGAAALAGFYRARIAADPSAWRWDTTALLGEWLAAGHRAHAIPIAGGWLEVDTETDRDLYLQLHQRGELAALCDLTSTDPSRKRCL